MALADDISISISVPPRTLETVSFTDGTLEELAQWLDRLPPDALDAARLLRNGLMELNRAKGFFTARFPELEMLRPRVHALCAQLDAVRVSGASAASARLEEEASLEQRVAQALQTELATGYRVVIAETLGERIQLKAGGTAESPTGIAVGAIHRALTELGFVLLRALRVNASSPSAFWEQVHQLYRLGESADVLAERVHDPLHQRHAETRVVDAWLRIVMLGGSDPHSLRAATLPALFGLLEDWTRFVEVTLTLPSEGAVTVVDVHGEEPPVRARAEELEADEGLRLLDTSELVAQLTRPRRSGTPADDDIARPQEDADDLLSHAARTWGADVTRGASRRTSSGRLEVCIGMGTIHRKLREAVTSGEDMTSLARVYLLELSDASPGGYGAVSDASVPAELRTGELLAVRKEATSIWHIAVARWIAEGADRTRLGIELLAPRALPAAAQSEAAAASGGKWVPVLLVPEIRALRKPAALIAPRGRFTSAQTLVLNRGGSVSRIELGESASFAESFRVFLYA